MFRRCMKSVCLLTAMLLMAGCSQIEQVENQAYAVAMGIDRTEEGGMEITVTLPQIAASGGEGEESGGSGGKYFQVSVQGTNYESAIEKLGWAVPRNLNFSQLKAVIFARSLAESDAFSKLIKSVVQTERLFTAAYVVVCEGKAKDFISGMKPAMGNRLSADITAMFDHYTEHGLIPGTTLADLYYRGMSLYSQPMAIYGLYSAKTEAEPKDVSTMALAGSPEKLASEIENNSEVHYLGAALFSKEGMCGRFDGAQTVLANLIRNELKSFVYEFEGKSLELSPVGSCTARIDVSSDPVRIQLGVKLAAVSQQEMPDMALLKRMLTADIKEVIAMAQELGVEPFGFAEKAVQKFGTIAKWRKFDWTEKFREAEVEIEIEFIRSDA